MAARPVTPASGRSTTEDGGHHVTLRDPERGRVADTGEDELFDFFDYRTILRVARRYPDPTSLVA